MDIPLSPPKMNPRGSKQVGETQVKKKLNINFEILIVFYRCTVHFEIYVVIGRGKSVKNTTLIS